MPLRISDPFSGGGTVAIEAARRGLPMHAQDLYPWPILGLQTCLSTPTLEEFDYAADVLRECLVPLETKYQRKDGAVLSHVIRVRIGTCPHCQRNIYLFPQHLVSTTHRDRVKADAFYGCSGCGHVHIGDPAVPPTHCPECCYPSPISAVRNERHCPHCEHRNVPLVFQQGETRWKVVLVQQVERKSAKQYRAVMRLPEESDPTRDQPAGDLLDMGVLIQDGQETRYLLNAGFRRWGELYTSRQAEVILQALKALGRLEISDGCRDRIALAVLGLGEMPAYLCRWDRLYQKVIEGTANHRYAHTTLVVETNLLSPVGRGTLGRRLFSARKALAWRLETIKSPAATQAIRKHTSQQARVQLQVGSSEVQSIPDGAITLVLTDPPYFDDVQYGELARLFHFWLNHYRPLAPIDETQEAVPNRMRGKTGDDYRQSITDCLRETRRTLHRHGRLIMTFHNRKFAAWDALARALHDAGYHVRALAVTRAENETDHSKRGGKGMLHDLVIECQPAQDNPPQVEVVRRGKSSEQREIRAIGEALAKIVAGDDRSLEEIFNSICKDTRVKGGRIA